MKLTKEEKRKIFWSLLEKYPEHERGRKQAQKFIKNEDELSEALGNINQQEEESYTLIKRFAVELDIDIPDIVKQL